MVRVRYTLNLLVRHCASESVLAAIFTPRIYDLTTVNTVLGMENRPPLSRPHDLTGVAATG
jgi:hypothetical protein